MTAVLEAKPGVTPYKTQALSTLHVAVASVLSLPIDPPDSSRTHQKSSV